jgi:hypothetical protein
VAPKGHSATLGVCRNSRHVRWGVCSLVLMGSAAMTAPPRVAPLPWYHRADYPALLLLFSDPNRVPNTFDTWLEHAEGVERQLQAAGFVVRSHTKSRQVRPKVVPLKGIQDMLRRWPYGRKRPRALRVGTAERGTWRTTENIS